VTTTQRAIDTVARRVLAQTVECALNRKDVDWGDYPEIGEDDWEKVCNRVRELAERGDVQDEHYQPAYRYLAGRADNAEGTTE
jgi:hypothetical protein